MLKGLAEQLSCVRYNTLTSVLDVVFLYVLLLRHGVAGYVAVFARDAAINLYLSIRRLLVATEHRPRAADFALPLLSLGLALLLTLPSPAMGGWLGAASVPRRLVPGRFCLRPLCCCRL